MNILTLKFNLFSFIFFLLINFTFFPRLKCQLIVPIRKEMNCYYIKIFFSEDKKKAEYIKINMALDFTFIPLSYNYSSSTQNSNAKIYLDNEIIEIDNREYNTKLISTNTFLLEGNNININNFKFFYINKKDLNQNEINKDYQVYNNLYFGQLGLGPIYNDNSLNLLYVLKEQNIIKKIISILILN